MATIAEVEKLALALPETERAALAAHLLGSLLQGDELLLFDLGTEVVGETQLARAYLLVPGQAPRLPRLLPEKR
jgi:hypothetical protein